MEFLNPIMFWGALAIAVPILLHFWHQKRGKVLPWAATQWLSEKSLQQSRGIKLENLLLLLLRVLLLLLLTLLLAKPWLADKKTKVYWVANDKAVVNNFKFELEEALTKGEKVYWLNGDLVENLSSIPTDVVDYQTGINKISAVLTGAEEAEIFIDNSSERFEYPKIFVPLNYHLHILKKKGNSAVEGLGKSEFNVLMAKSNENINAALKAIEGVYQVVIHVENKRTDGKVYDLVINDADAASTNEPHLIYNADKLTVQQTINGNLISEDLNSLSPDVVFRGELPEVIAQILANQELKNNVLNEQQVRDRFEKRTDKNQKGNHWLNTILVILFLLLLGLERGLAIRKNT